MKYRQIAHHVLAIFCLMLTVLLLGWVPAINDFLFPAAIPELKVINPQGKDHDGDKFCYWIANSCVIDIRFRNSRRPTFPFELFLDVIAGPANRSPRRTIEIVDDAGRAQTATFYGRQIVHFPINIKHGLNSFTLRVVSPTDWQVHIPGDPRKHMLRLESIDLKRVSSGTPSPTASHPELLGNS